MREEEEGEEGWQRKPVGWQPPPAPAPPAAPTGWQLAESIWAPRALRSDSGGLYETAGVQRRAARRDFDRAVAERRLGTYIVSRGANDGGNGDGDGGGGGGGDGDGDGYGDGDGGDGGGGVASDAEELRKAYRKLAIRYPEHLDRHEESWGGYEQAAMLTLLRMLTVLTLLTVLTTHRMVLCLLCSLCLLCLLCSLCVWRLRAGERGGRRVRRAHGPRGRGLR